MANRIAEHMQRIMDATPGVTACALVDATSGLVWHRCGDQSTAEETQWEAAVDYWRLHARQHEHFASLGDLGAAVMYHRQGVLAILPCRNDTGLLVVCRANHQGVDWRGWQKRVRELSNDIGESL
jgi:hypothetical protein